MKRFSNLITIAAIGLLGVASSARADLITLPGYTVFQEAEGITSSVANGTANYADLPGVATMSNDLGTATVGDFLGVGTSVSLTSDLEEYAPPGGGLSGGGTVQSTLTYFVDYVDPCTPMPGCTNSTDPVTVALTASQSMTNGPSVSSYPGYSGFFPTVQTWLNIAAFDGPTAINETACLEYCEEGFGVTTTFQSGTTTQNITMNENTVYQVTIGVYASGLGPATAEVDPTFAVSGGDGTFAYSAGIESASTPEPASWATALIGFGLLTGLRLHQRAKDTSRA